MSFSKVLKTIKNPQGCYTINSYLKRVLFGTVLPVTASLMILAFVFSWWQYAKVGDRIFQGLKMRIELVLKESMTGLVNAASHYEPEIMKLLKEAAFYVESHYKKSGNYEELELSNLESKYRKSFPAILFKEINFYIIDETGKVIWTDYEPDLGLDLSKFGDFWQRLNTALLQGDVFHRGAFEVQTGKMRLFAYHRLSNGHVLELGLLLNTENFSESLSRLKVLSAFSEKLGVYNVAKIPLRSDFPAFPENLMKFHPYKRDLVGEVGFEVFPGYFEKLYIYSRLNFISIYGIVIFTFVMFLVQFVFLSLVFSLFSRESSREVRLLHEGLTSFRENRNFYLNPSSTKFEEFREILETLNGAILELNEDERRNQELIRELNESFYDFGERLAMVAEGYDPETGEHIRRVKYLTKLIAQRVDMPQNLKDEIVSFSVLHDVGKVYIPVEILNKPGPLTPQEWELMRQHTVFARRLLAHPRFKVALDIALYHHENFNGGGYPFGLDHDAIPICGRIIKIIDVYDALRSKRPYKVPVPHEEAKRIMLEGDDRTKPQDFDPHLLKIFFEEIEKVDLADLYR